MKLETEQKSEIEMLKHIQTDLSFLKNKIISLELDVEEINEDIHREINPKFVKEVKRLQKQKGVGIKFNNMKEFYEHYSK